MLFKSGMLTQASGSLGGLTASHNRGGLYLRSRAIPVDPASPTQQDRRIALATLTARWADTLTQAQRDAWELYSDNVPLVGPLGSPRAVGGLGMYIRTNVPRDIVGLAPLDTAPAIFDIGSFTPVSVSLTVLGSVIDVTFDNTDAWANEDDAYMLVQAGRPTNAGVAYFKGPFRFADSIAGNSTTAPTSPASITSPFAFASGQRVFVRVRVLRADGRLSAAQVVSAVA